VRLKEAERRAAEAALRDLLAGSRPQEIGAARATVARADAEAVRLVRDDERAAALYSRGVIAAREYEAAKAASEVARARVKEAREALLLVEEGPRKETIELARARLEQAGEALKLAKVRLGYGSVTASFCPKMSRPGTTSPRGPRWLRWAICPMSGSGRTSRRPTWDGSR
jgi:HlyD family secretion protein